MKENESANSVVSVRNLVKRYGDILALDHFNLEIGKGEIFGLLGPNGCGKTTAINCMLQLLVYDKGDIELFGEAMKPTRYDLKRRIGVVPQQVAVFDELTVFENIDCFCALYVGDKTRRRELVEEAIRLGFSSVMYDCSMLPFEENVRRTREMAAKAHAAGCSLEAEIGHVGSNGSAEEAVAKTIYTQPQDALRFAAESGCDALAVAIGTAHGVYA